jgi:hypothetical protein
VTQYYWQRGEAIQAKFVVHRVNCERYIYYDYFVFDTKGYAQANAIQAEGFNRYHAEEAMKKARGSRL